MPEPKLEAAVAAVADALAEKATGDWTRLIWRATLYRGGTFEERVELVPTSGAPPVSPLALARMGFVMSPGGRRAVEELATALAAADDADRHAVELTVEPGRLEVVVSTALTQSTGHLPPTYRIVVDPAPPTAHTEDAEPVVAQGDPGRAVELAETYASLYAEVTGERPALRPPRPPRSRSRTRNEPSA